MIYAKISHAMANINFKIVVSGGEDIAGSNQLKPNQFIFPHIYITNFIHAAKILTSVLYMLIPNGAPYRTLF